EAANIPPRNGEGDQDAKRLGGGGPASEQLAGGPPPPLASGERSPAPSRGGIGSNLLALSVEAARVRATLGEISDALERAFGRYGTMPEPVRGIYGKARRDARWKAAEQGTQSVASRLGRKPRIMVAKMGQDGHDRGANLVSSAFTDLG